MQFPVLQSAEEIAALVEKIGFLPFFRGEIAGFSVEECTPPRLWFSAEEDGPWEWKGPVIRLAHCAYGKFYRGKAMFVSREWFPDFANFRRDGYDYDARMDEGIARRRDTYLMEELMREPSLLGKDLKARVCFTEERKKGYEGSLTRLQMMCYITTAGFEYARDKHGKEYGWGLARYAMPEAFFGEDFCRAAYKRPPQESYARMAAHLKEVLPHASDRQISRILLL